MGNALIVMMNPMGMASGRWALGRGRCGLQQQLLRCSCCSSFDRSGS
jgi:hypothetical protein